MASDGLKEGASRLVSALGAKSMREALRQRPPTRLPWVVAADSGTVRIDSPGGKVDGLVEAPVGDKQACRDIVFIVDAANYHEILLDTVVAQASVIHLLREALEQARMAPEEASDRAARFAFASPANVTVGQRISPSLLEIEMHQTIGGRWLVDGILTQVRIEKLDGVERVHVYPIDEMVPVGRAAIAWLARKSDCVWIPIDQTSRPCRVGVPSGET